MAEVHWVGKLRMAIHEICALVIVVQSYWFEHFYVNVSLLLGFMALASLTALVLYNFFHRKKIGIVVATFLSIQQRGLLTPLSFLR